MPWRHVNCAVDLTWVLGFRVRDPAPLPRCGTAVLRKNSGGTTRSVPVYQLRKKRVHAHTAWHYTVGGECPPTTELTFAAYSSCSVCPGNRLSSAIRVEAAHIQASHSTNNAKSFHTFEGYIYSSCCINLTIRCQGGGIDSFRLQPLFSIERRHGGCKRQQSIPPPWHRIVKWTKHAPYMWVSKVCKLFALLVL